MHLPRRITAADTLHVFEVRALHADEQIVLLVVLRRELARSVSLAGNAVLGELAPRGRIDGIADLIAARRRGVDLKFVNSSASPAFSTRSFITNSAIGLRQILPKQINKIFVIVFLRKF